MFDIYKIDVLQSIFLTSSIKRWKIYLSRHLLIKQYDAYLHI